MADKVGEHLKEGDYIQIKGRLVENKYTPKELEGKLDEKGRQITKSQIKIIAYDYKYVRYNEELEEFEYIDQE